MIICNKEDVIKAIETHNVKFIRLQFTDIQGVVKDVEIPVTQIEKALTSGIYFDGSSIEGFVRIDESDMTLKPDVRTFAILPWSKDKGGVARIICDIQMPDGRNFEADPRYVLKKVMKEAEEMGYTFNVGPELEFFLFEKVEGKATTNPHDFGRYFEFAPTDLAEDIRRDIVLTLTDLNFDIEASHHEVAFGQHEIDFKYGDALTTADNVITFKYVTRTIAKLYGLHATFMPKPIAVENGSGMHVNLSLSKSDENAFYDPNGEMEISETTKQFIAGVLKHIKAISCISNPLVNSYKRLIPGYEAPVYITWSGANRSSLIRIPSARGKSTRVELRSPDPSCNPYLTFAAILAAGLDGIKNQMDPGKIMDYNVFDLTKEERMERGIDTLPSTISESADYLEKDELLKNTLGPHVHDNILRLARAEWDAYRTQVHDWEIQRYLNTI
ncbi:L-glutamine synthetase [Methanolobus vulcani]|jgi:glutamine synthetase|uniref:Glutamine synthetase n=1 Tax=Methanolobus vulcani TaxID=38026 RepID=A0A7Z7B1B1_9EURY|nr:type I glutamate--ammonia ligase [Methanolobus vulcani]MDK2826567.1 glutamine synthetase [Methanolobus sp.]MDK2947730.1 glutamine synthetase [Methanolobus sp.]SDF72322.1 L-glutamine synthetase [Methanolobus vulcani]